MEVALSTIKGQNNKSFSFIVLLGLLGIIASGCNQSSSKKDQSLEFEILQRANIYIENGDFENAGTIYEQFIEKFSTDPYVDDAAYRFAYLHVIADDRNPYFDYKKAELFFQKFIETYPNSRYIMACKNWLNLLESIAPAPVDPVIIKVKENADPVVVNRLKAEIKTLQIENARLKQTLDELQRAIER